MTNETNAQQGAEGAEEERTVEISYPNDLKTVYVENVLADIGSPEALQLLFLTTLPSKGTGGDTQLRAEVSLILTPSNAATLHDKLAGWLAKHAKKGD